MKADIPIGRIIRQHRIEARREILNACVSPASAESGKLFSICPHEPILGRQYHIIHNGKPLIFIEEQFPYNRFLNHARRRQAHQRQAHRHAVVVVGVERRAVQLAGDDPQAVVLLLDRGAELPQLGGQRPDAVGLLVANMGDAANGGGPAASRATAASVCTVSLMAFMSTSMPRKRAAGHGQAAGSPRTWQPICSRQSQKATSPCRLCRLSPSTVTLPPVMAAAARK